ncbi:MAG: universal stress protein [Ardenticatenia bacterium]|nr:universal stress protein [Ardenticatenia bacterium]
MRILVATGGAPHSTLAVIFGGLLAHDLDAHLTLLTVIKPAAEREKADRILRDAGVLLNKYVPSPDTRVRVGHPAEEIVKEAEEGAYQLVVVGERQHHTLRTRFLLGATAERVVEHAPCPVVVAKGRVTPVRRLLLCEGVRNRQTLVKRLVEQLPELLDRAQPELTVLHVMSQVSVAPGKSGNVLAASVDELIARGTSEGQRLDRDRQLLEQRGVHPHLKVRHGLVVEEIIHEAREGEYDLIVVGAHRGERWRRILLDDLTHEILVESDRPVLVVR